MREAKATLDDHYSKMSSHQVRDAVSKATAVTAQAMGAPGDLADLTGHVAGRAAQMTVDAAGPIAANVAGRMDELHTRNLMIGRFDGMG